MLGRTYGNKGKSLIGTLRPRLTALNLANRSAADRRADIVAVFREQLNPDVTDMIAVASKGSDDVPSWGDIHTLIPDKKQRDPFIDKVRKQILAGEGRMRSQDVEGYKK